MQFYYSFYGSPLHLLLEESIADGYNRACKAFYEAQAHHKQLHGVQWTPDQPLWIETSDEDQAAYAAVGDLINKLIEINGGGLQIPEEEMTDDYLVKL